MSAQSFVTTWSELSVAERRAMWTAAWIKRCQEREGRIPHPLDRPITPRVVKPEPPAPPPPPPPPKVKKKPKPKPQPKPKRLKKDGTEHKSRTWEYPKFNPIDEFPMYMTSTIPMHGKRRPIYNNSDGERSTDFWWYLGSALAAGNQALPSDRLTRKSRDTQ